MELTIVIALVGTAFFCEFIDSALGMGYGTILTPALIIVGFDTLEVVPAVLMSQAIASSSAAAFHNVHGNLAFEEGGKDRGIALLVIALSSVFITLAVFLAIGMPETVQELYIALVVISMGVALLTIRQPCQSYRRLMAFGLFSVFNKSVTGAGFGPVYTNGQIMCGKEPRNAIAITTLLEAPVCLIAFLAYLFIGGAVDMELLVVLSIGALLATPIGPARTKRLDGYRGRAAVGVLSIFLGLFILIWLLLRPFAEEVISNPFFWAMLSMFALMGCTASLLTRRLGRYPSLNVGCVAIFALGRFMIPIACCEQPQFDAGPAQFAVGTSLFVLGLCFLSAILYINPWPVVDARYRLVTEGPYHLVRHPMYLGEILWTLGWSVMFGSVLGVALVPIWWGALLFHSLIEEEALERRYGDDYSQYEERVQGRIFPGLPI